MNNAQANRFNNDGKRNLYFIFYVVMYSLTIKYVYMYMQRYNTGYLVYRMWIDMKIS